MFDGHLMVTMVPASRDAAARPWGHLAIMTLAIAVVWAGIAINLWQQHSAAKTQSIADTSNLVHAFAENITRTVEAIDQMLLLVRDAYRQDPDSLDLQTLVAVRNPLKGIDVQVSIADRTGTVVRSSSGEAGSVLDLPDLAQLQAQSGSTDRLTISAPVTGSASHPTTIRFLRKLVSRGGAFDGIVIVSVNPYDLSRFYETISIGAGAVTLLNLDGVILARAPAAKDFVGKTLISPYLGTVRSGPATGTFTARSAIDNIPRIYSYRRLDDFGLVLNVGLSEDDVFSAFRSNCLLGIAVGLGLSAAIIVTTLLTLRQRKRLFESGQALYVTLENMSQGIEMIGPDGCILVINSRAVELMGLPADLVAGRPDVNTLLKWQIEHGELGPPDTWPAGLTAALDAGGWLSEDHVYERTRPNGMVLEVRTRAMPDGGAVRTFTDVTARKRTEAELASARDAAEASGRARTEFLAMMSHEIRTPMNSIIGFAALLLDMPISSPALRYITIIKQSGEHLLRIINDILDLSKLDAGRLQLQSVVFELRTEIRGTIDLMNAQAQQKHLALQLDIASAVPRRVYGDPGRLRQVMINLIGNAIKFTSTGHVKVRITRSSRHLSPLDDRLSDDGKVTLSFSVADTGIGIAEEKIDILFQHFTQIETATERQYGGTGLGLAISQRLVQQMGGKIGVRSEPGQGSTFFFDLPFKVAEDALGGRALTPAIDQRAGYHVLLADDNDSNRTAIARMLESRGHQVDTAGSGRLALEAVRSSHYDLVVMDLIMPDLDGFAAAAAIRALPGRRGKVPIIGLTANTREGDEESCFRAGMSACLVKPVSADLLTIVIGDVIEKVVTEG